MKPKKYTAEDVRNARRLLGMNQRELAAELGIVPQHLSGIENNKYPASARVCRNLDRALEAHDKPNAIRGAEEAHLIYMYRAIPPESQRAVISTAEALYAAIGGAPHPIPPETSA